MIQKQYGIVLKRFVPKKQKIAVFDRSLGRIDCIPHIDTLCHGAVISYYVGKTQPLHHLHNVELIDVPFSLAHAHIHFLHKVLLVCYYFIPQGSAAPEAFDLLRFLYTIENNKCVKQFQLVFVCKLFALLGFVPNTLAVDQFIVDQLLTTSIDRLTNYPLELGIEQLLGQWIDACIALHPRAQLLKTMILFKTDGIL